MRVNLLSSGISHISVISDVLKKSGPVSHLAIDVLLTKDSSLNPGALHLTRIIALAVEGIGETTQKSNWKSKFFKLTIGVPVTKRIDYLFYTKECRKYLSILRNKGKAEALKYLLTISSTALKRAKNHKNSWYE